MLGWLGRTALLILAGLATLSIIAAIAAIPSGPSGMIPADSGERIAPVVPEAGRPLPSGRPDTAPEPAPADGQRGSAATALSPSGDADARWMQALTYTVLAVAGLLAAILLLLLRIAARIADLRDTRQ